MTFYFAILRSLIWQYISRNNITFLIQGVKINIYSHIQRKKEKSLFFFLIKHKKKKAPPFLRAFILVKNKKYHITETTN